MTLAPKHKRQLRALGHHLKPVVSVGNKGLSDDLHRELDSSLEHHELLKVKISCGDRTERDRVIDLICQNSHAELVQRIGHIALIYRPRSKNPGIQLV